MKNLKCDGCKLPLSSTECNFCLECCAESDAIINHFDPVNGHYTTKATCYYHQEIN